MRLKVLGTARESDSLTAQQDRLRVRMKSDVRHPLWCIKLQSGYTRIRHASLARCTADVVATLFLLSGLWMARRNLIRPSTFWHGCL